MSMYRERIKRACELMENHGLDIIILTNPANMFYLTGDGRLCAYVMVTRAGKVAIGVPQTDIKDVQERATMDHIVGFEDEVGMIHSLADNFKRFGIQEGSLGLEYAFLPKPRIGMLTHPHGKPEAVDVKDCTALMSELRLIKDDNEIIRLQVAARVADAGMEAAISSIKIGMTESQVAAEAEYAMRYAGAEDFYKTYVASGPRTNIAHGIPTVRKLERGDLVTIDVHPVVNGYTADLCRTVCVGKPTGAQQEAFDLYVRALEATMAKAKAGVEMMTLEQTMHDMFKAAGHQNHIFGPPIHGVGIQFEEAPLPAGHAFFHGEAPPLPLDAGVVIAIGNCGLYTGQWGVREEDTVVVGAQQPLVLTRHPRQLEIPV
ncbi:MAG: Xaa-Pro peptidase family protein [Methanosarcinaceae archaeon]|nr:Xaa-Pro peptidase family protein [Methanosarcinaceae archaeon]